MGTKYPFFSGHGIPLGTPMAHHDLTDGRSAIVNIDSMNDNSVGNTIITDHRSWIIDTILTIIIVGSTITGNVDKFIKIIIIGIINPTIRFIITSNFALTTPPPPPPSRPYPSLPAESLAKNGYYSIGANPPPAWSNRQSLKATSS